MGSWDSSELPWRPPSWWDIGSNVNDPSNRCMIENAYKKAEVCGKCRNFSWPREGIQLEPQDIEKLHASAQAGCAGCMAMCSIVTLIEYHMNDDYRPKSPYSCSFRFEQSRILFYSGFHYEVYSPNVQDHVWKIPHLSPELQVSSWTGSARAVKRTQLWLRECEDTHHLCVHSNSPLPSRVLRIRGPQQVELYESHGEIVPYACLSHCWGKKHIIRTTKTTLPHHKQSISWKRLPLTFQHAVSFTYRLGLEYLWIDSLCIIQDDAEDWRREGSKMAQIYSGAYITLAATASRNASGGLFRHTPDRPLLRLKYPDGKGSRLDLCIRPRMKGLGQSHVPLLRRAWTLQERLLSRRTLHFTHDELVWECRTRHDCECSIPHPQQYNLYRLDSSWLIHSLSIHQDRVKLNIWWQLVEQYSHQRLTYEKDIFPALQGISKIFSTYTKSRYLAGLWETSLIPDLLWYCGANAGLKEWRAPSWSWASVLGPVKWGARSDAAHFYLLATCTAAEVETASRDEFGEILSATITLRGRCFPTAMQQSWIHFTHGPESRFKFVYLDDPVWKALIFVLAVYPDFRRSEVGAKRPCSKALEQATRFKTVLMAKTLPTNSTPSCYSCLVLKQRDVNSDTYERVAYMNVIAMPNVDESMFPLDEEETLRIV